MSTLLAQIDYDCNCLRSYFTELFVVLQKAVSDNRNAPIEALDAGSTESLASYHPFSHFIKPDMTMNIYSLLDFRMREICKYQKGKKDLSLSYKDIKGRNDLCAYKKYLTRYAGIDLSALKTSYTHLDNLRKVRNYFMHGGGYVADEKEVKNLSRISGIDVSLTSLIIVQESFVWESLDHANKYLRAAAHD